MEDQQFIIFFNFIFYFMLPAMHKNFKSLREIGES